MAKTKYYDLPAGKTSRNLVFLAGFILGEKMYTVYMHVCPNNKRYIGITKREPSARWGHNGIGYKRNTHFYNAIKLYGWENIKHIIIATDLTLQDAG